MKCEIFYDTDLRALRDQVNDFIKDKKVISLNLSLSGPYTDDVNAIVVLYDDQPNILLTPR